MTQVFQRMALMFSNLVEGGSRSKVFWVVEHAINISIGGIIVSSLQFVVVQVIKDFQTF